HLQPLAEPAARQLAANKVAMVAELQNGTPVGRERHLALHRINAELESFAADTRRQLERELAEIETGLRANAVVGRRDFALCLYPEEMLRPFCTRFLSRGWSESSPAV